MTLSVPVIVTAIALLAVLAARRGVMLAAARSPVAARLRSLYTLIAVLLGLRLIAPLVKEAPLVIALMLVATWLPIAALRLIEELRRRHASRSIKLIALGGAFIFSLLAVTLGMVWSAGAALGLALYQLTMLALMVVLLARGRDDLGERERRTADTFLLALLLVIPLALTDFVALFPGLTIRGGAFAALLLVLATSRLSAGGGSPRRLIGDLAIAVGAGGASVIIALAAQSSLPGSAAILVAAGGIALACLLLIVARSRASGDDGAGLIAALTKAPERDPAALIAAHPMLAAARLLGPADLAAYPQASIARLLDHPVVSASTDDRQARDAARDLLDAHAATHLVRLSRTPPRILAVAAGSLAAPALDDELALVARLIEHAA